MDLVKFLEKNEKLHILIIMVTLKVTTCKTMSKKKKVKKVKIQDPMGKQTSFRTPCPSALGQFSPRDYM
jgi:hypothetical protein